MRYFANRLFTMKQTLRLLFTHHLKTEQRVRHLLYTPASESPTRLKHQAAVKVFPTAVNALSSSENTSARTNE
jgi:hypothetical protein